MLKLFFSLISSTIITLFFKNKILEIPIEKYTSNIEALLTISSIIFAIVGVWIAVIYPKIIQKSADSLKDVAENEIEAGNLSRLIEITIFSSLILLTTIIISFSKILITDENSFYKLILFYVLITCSKVQILSLIDLIMIKYSLLEKIRYKNISDFKKNVFK